jgi:acetyltransferase-like isoleucine patch superfamily enzyme
MLFNLILFFCKASFIEKFFLFFLKKNQLYSKLLRKYFRIKKGVVVGDFSYGCFTSNLPNGTIIGNYCSFAPGIKIFNGNHGIKFATTHPFLYNTNLGMVKKETIKRYSLRVGHGVWIGDGVLILPSVKEIGNGCIIGAGSVVSKDVKPYSIVVGNPAKHIKYRFNQEYIDILETKNIYSFRKKDFINTIDYMYDEKQFHKIKSINRNE